MATTPPPFDTHGLQRWPQKSHESLQAHDGADERLWEVSEPGALVVNDRFGAIALNVADPIACWSDSYCCAAALQHNAAARGQHPPRWLPMDSDWPWAESPITQVLLRLPKDLGLLDWQLRCLRYHLPGVTLHFAGMVKHWPKQLAERTRDHLDEIEVGRVERKARRVQGRLKPLRNFTPKPHAITLPEEQLTLLNQAGVFASEKIDIGARAMLAQFDKLPHQGDAVLDLGCGNGILGMSLHRRRPDWQVTFTDESVQALASARAGVAHNFAPQVDWAQFHLDDCASQLADQRFDLVLCNPPFHQEHAVGDWLAQRMFAQAHRVLKHEGELWVVGNRHLGYHVSLKKHFRRVDQLGGDNKFVVLRAQR